MSEIVLTGVTGLLAEELTRVNTENKALKEAIKELLYDYEIDGENTFLGRHMTYFKTILEAK